MDETKKDTSTSDTGQFTNFDIYIQQIPYELEEDGIRPPSPSVTKTAPMIENISPPPAANTEKPPDPTPCFLDEAKEIEIPKDEWSTFQEAGSAKDSWKVIDYPVNRLPNCKMAGTDYRVNIEELIQTLQQNQIQHVTFRSKSGNINWKRVDGTKDICGQPMEPGDFDLELCVDVQKCERHVFPLKLTVNPDPKTLWKDIPSNPNGIYAKPDSERAFFACSEELSIAAASQRGRSHAQDGKPRDDDFAFKYDATSQSAVLVVADGAGSAKFSRKGSQIAVQTTLEEVIKALSDEFWSSLVPPIQKWKNEHDTASEKVINTAMYRVLIHAAFEAKKCIEQEAREHQARYMADYKKDEKFSGRDYATTLILSLVKKFDFGWFIASYWVGDGAVAIYRPADNELILHGIPDSGEYGGQTRFLTENSDSVWPNDAHALIQRRIRFDVVDAFKAIILMTDGISDPRFETEKNLEHLGEWNELWADMEKVVPFTQRNEAVSDALLAWMNFWAPGSHDDRTMVILY